MATPTSVILKLVCVVVACMVMTTAHVDCGSRSDNLSTCLPTLSQAGMSHQLVAVASDPSRLLPSLHQIVKLLANALSN
ncbi:hypothetical protein FRX31_030684 [Thalictrum thalictroides]|uniref:Uncharacterized protein n=1 Tax=Thalictrum thalictroides TaxID=46969 RepID=A0A7J6V3U5_THATH|nr:hypothetical protein FRX31_030684 [Thalictrum thalictroides]